MYQPTKNLSQILRAEDYTEHELFETEAVREAQARFKAGLKKEGYSSVEAMLEALRGEEEADLEFQTEIMEREAEELHFEAVKPTLSPEESFEFEVSAFEVEETINVFNIVLSELYAIRERNQYGN